MCFGAKKAAKIQAKAVMDSANMEAANLRLQAQSAAQQQQTILAQDKAATAAAELLDTPQGQVEVQLASNTTAPLEVDAVTGRRRTPRSAFQSTSSSGISI